MFSYFFFYGEIIPFVLFLVTYSLFGVHHPLANWIFKLRNGPGYYRNCQAEAESESYSVYE